MQWATQKSDQEGCTKQFIIKQQKIVFQITADIITYSIDISFPHFLSNEIIRKETREMK